MTNTATTTTRTVAPCDPTQVLARLAPFSQVVQRRIHPGGSGSSVGNSNAKNVAQRRSSRWMTKTKAGDTVRQIQKVPVTNSSLLKDDEIVEKRLTFGNQGLDQPDEFQWNTSQEIHAMPEEQQKSGKARGTTNDRNPLQLDSSQYALSQRSYDHMPHDATGREFGSGAGDRIAQDLQPADTTPLDDRSSQVFSEKSKERNAIGDNLSHSKSFHSNQLLTYDGSPKPRITTLNGWEQLDKNDNSELATEDPEREASATFDLRNRRHIDVEKGLDMTLARTHRRAPVARDWTNNKKRFVAAMQCINTSLIGLIIGIYAGEVPAIQYYIVDQKHFTVLGNVLFFVGMAIPLLLLHSLPSLHGRKPYTLGAFAILMPLMFPQALAIQAGKSFTDVNAKVLLLVPRALAGVAAGFIQMNLMATLLDLFGASLQSANPHQEVVDLNDVRRHGGGMGVWLGIWTWCATGTIGLGFFLGACLISRLSPDWGFWISVMLCAIVLLLNVMAPETRRSPYRRSSAEVRTGTEVFRRFAKGEFMMHLYQVGPVHWWEEMMAGWVLVIRMIAQPGFLMLALYQGWVYAEVVMLIIVLGNLTSVDYQFAPVFVGLSVLSVPFGALMAIPFQKASLFSRSRRAPPRTDSMTFEKRLTWTSHLVRRAFFMIALPLCTMAYTLCSGGNKTSVALPILFATGVGFLSNLALSEVFGIIMETFDTSDLQPGMTGRPRRVIPDSIRGQRTNFSCFPRVTSAFMIVQSIAFLISAAATGAGGTITHHVGAQKATGIVCGILFGLSVFLILALTRFRTVQVVPTRRYATAELSGAENDWKPVIIGHPSGTTRRVSLLELGNMTRWTEIRRRNKVFGMVPISSNGSRRLNRGADRAGD